jgi:predicted RNA-binding protein associated with RNAse of E/G family
MMDIGRITTNHKNVYLFVDLFVDFNVVAEVRIK